MKCIMAWLFKTWPRSIDMEWQQRLWDRALAEFHSAGKALAAAQAAHAMDPTSPEAEHNLEFAAAVEEAAWGRLTRVRTELRQSGWWH
jgi:hypothetical protein